MALHDFIIPSSPREERVGRGPRSIQHPSSPRPAPPSDEGEGVLWLRLHRAGSGGSFQFAAGVCVPALGSASQAACSALTRSNPPSFGSTSLEILPSRISMRRGVEAAI